MRQLTAAAAITAIGLLVAACGGNDQSSPASSTKTTTTTPTPTPTPTPTQPPVAQAALPNLLLSPAEVDSALGMTGSTSQKKSDKLSDESVNQQWPQGWKFPTECVYAMNPGQTPMYANSGYIAVSGDDTSAAVPGSNDPNPEVTQFVVSFPSAKEANAFFTTSSQRWPACASRQFTAPGDADTPEVAFTVGQVSNANSILTTTVTANMTTKDGKSMTIACQRALTIRNNIAIDVSGCRKDPGDLAVKVANQIAGKADSANVNLLATSLSKGYGLNNCNPVAAAQLTGLALAELDCGQSPDAAGPASAVYRLLPHADALASDFKAMIQDISLAPCRTDSAQSPGSWQQGQTAGQVACGTQKNAAVLTWTTDGKNVLGSIHASNTDIDALHQWWLSNG
jgi:PknH-like extracellular domain